MLSCIQKKTDLLTGFRKGYPKIWQLDVLNILSWRNLGETSWTSPAAGHAMLCERCPPSRARSVDPEEVWEDKPRGALATPRIGIKWEAVAGESRVHWRYRESTSTDEWETQKGKERESHLCSGLRFLLRTVVWCMCPFVHPGTG